MGCVGTAVVSSMQTLFSAPSDGAAAASPSLSRRQSTPKRSPPTASSRSRPSPSLSRATSQSGEADDDNCIICMGVIEGGTRCRPVSCRHMYCEPCLQEWAQLNNTCPLCKARFTAIITLDVFERTSDATRLRKDAETAFWVTKVREGSLGVDLQRTGDAWQWFPSCPCRKPLLLTKIRRDWATMTMGRTVW